MSKNKGNRDYRCFHCNGTGHTVRKCPNKKGYEVLEMWDEKTLRKIVRWSKVEKIGTGWEEIKRYRTL